jgi:hypothetical protein
MDGFFGDQVTAHRSASAMVQLAAGDRVNCRTDYQVSLMAASSYPQFVGGANNAISEFEAFLIGAEEIEDCPWEGTWTSETLYQETRTRYELNFTRSDDGYTVTYGDGTIRFVGTGNDLIGVWTSMGVNSDPDCPSGRVEFHKVGCGFQGSWERCPPDTTVYAWSGQKVQ